MSQGCEFAVKRQLQALNLLCMHVSYVADLGQPQQQ